MTSTPRPSQKNSLGSLFSLPLLSRFTGGSKPSAKVEIDASGASRVDPLGSLMSKQGREDLRSITQAASRLKLARPMPKQLLP
ncbi:MAG: hypothetical protein ACKOYK_10730 [Cyanobium sp.]